MLSPKILFKHWSYETSEKTLSTTHCKFKVSFFVFPESFFLETIILPSQSLFLREKKLSTRAWKLDITLPSAPWPWQSECKEPLLKLANLVPYLVTRGTDTISSTRKYNAWMVVHLHRVPWEWCCFPSHIYVDAILLSWCCQYWEIKNLFVAIHMSSKKISSIAWSAWTFLIPEQSSRQPRSNWRKDRIETIRVWMHHQFPGPNWFQNLPRYNSRWNSTCFNWQWKA